jgi:ferredoxin-NADP reductase
MKPVSIVTVKAPNDRNGNLRRAYIILSWDEEKQHTSTTILREDGCGMRGTVEHIVADPYQLPSVTVSVSAGEFKRLFKG